MNKHIIMPADVHITTKKLMMCFILYACIGLALDSSQPEFMRKSRPKLETSQQRTGVTADKSTCMYIKMFVVPCTLFIT